MATPRLALSWHPQARAYEWFAMRLRDDPILRPVVRAWALRLGEPGPDYDPAKLDPAALPWVRLTAVPESSRIAGKKGGRIVRLTTTTIEIEAAVAGGDARDSLDLADAIYDAACRRLVLDAWDMHRHYVHRLEEVTPPALGEPAPGTGYTLATGRIRLTTRS